MALRPGHLLSSKKAIRVAEIPLRGASRHLLKVGKSIGQDLPDLDRTFKGDSRPLHDRPLNVRVVGPSGVRRKADWLDPV
eukprot:5272933-Amphidinium_carterae.1